MAIRFGRFSRTAARQMKRRSALNRSLAAVTAAALGITLLAGCGPASATKNSAEGSAGLQSFTFLSYLPMESLSMAPEMMAIAGGYFEKHGLDVEVQEVKGSPQAMQTLLSGVADLTRVGALDVYVAAGEKKMPLVNVGTLVRSSSIKILHSSEAPLNDPQDFVGKTIGVPSEGGSSDKTLSLMLSNAGIDPATVKRQVVGLTPATFALVQKGTLAGYMVSNDSALIAAKQNDDALIYDFGTTVKADMQVYVSTPDAIKKNPGNLGKYMAAIKEATAAIVADESLDETIKTLRTKYSFATLMDDDIAKKGLGQARKLWTADGTSPLLTTDEDSWAVGYQELTDAGMVPDGEDAAGWVDNSLLPQ